MSSPTPISELLDESFSSVQGNDGGGGDVSVEEAADETAVKVLNDPSRSVEIPFNNNDLEFHPGENDDENDKELSSDEEYEAEVDPQVQI